MDREKLIRNKVKGGLSVEEESAFELLIKSNASFASEYHFFLDMHLAIKAFEKDNLKQQITKLETRRKRHIKTLWYSISGIAVAIMLFVFYNPFYKTTCQELYNDQFQVYPNTYQPVVRGESNAQALAFVAYENGDYNTSTILFNQLLSEKENNNLRFYYALSFLYLNETKKALDEFNTLESVAFQYQKQVFWYKGLLLLKMDKPIEARQIFEKLKLIFPEYKTQKIKHILNVLNYLSSSYKCNTHI